MYLASRFITNIIIGSPLSSADNARSNGLPIYNRRSRFIVLRMTTSTPNFLHYEMKLSISRLFFLPTKTAPLANNKASLVSACTNLWKVTKAK